MAHRVGIFGATGYAGRELVQRVQAHPRLQLVAACARQDAGRDLNQVFASGPRQPLLSLEQAPLANIETLFLCLPHGASAEWAKRGLEAGCRVIDLSADFRLRDPANYAATYGLPHPCPEHLPDAVYGLTELNREALASTRLVANPGCYPTSILLALAPLQAENLLSGLVISDSKSGVSGAGRGASVANLFAEVSENVRPYQVGDQHRHRAEVLQELRGQADLLFVPHVVPCIRGMLSNLYVNLPAHADVHSLYQDFYRNEAFVSVLPPGEISTMAHSSGSNRCVLSLHPLPDQQRLLVISSIDNLLKGAAGQALQNLNLALGWPETEGLL